MKSAQCCFSEVQLSQLREACFKETRLVALYAFDLRQGSDCNFAALFMTSLTWPERLDLELTVSECLGLEGVELIDLRRMPLVTRFDVVNRGDPIYVGQPDALAMFIEETIVRYAAFYPLLEALYWQVETGPLAEDRLDQPPASDGGQNSVIQGL
jgi:hypothetical protein